MNTYESKKHRSNKLSIIANRNGIPLGIKLGNGNIHDIKLLMDTLPNKTYFKILYADKGYVSKKLKEKPKTKKYYPLNDGMIYNHPSFYRSSCQKPSESGNLRLPPLTQSLRFEFYI